MQREYTTTFLGFTPHDIDDFVTIRHRFDNALQYRLSINEMINHQTKLNIQEEKYFHLTKEQEKIEEEIKQIKQSKLLNQILNPTEKLISFPYQSFLNIRHWRKAPKSLRIFFQALTCFFSISNKDFLTELKVNHNFIPTIEFYQPSSTVMDEFRLKYSNSEEISVEYIRKKSCDAYTIAIWMHNIEEKERLNRIKQLEIETHQRLESQLNQLNLNLLNKQKEIQLIEHKIQTLKKNLNQTEKHHQRLSQSN